MTDYGNLAQIAGAFVAIVSFGTSIWAARSKRFDDKIDAVVAKSETADNALRAEIGRVFARVDGVEQRVARAENELAHLPSKDVVSDLRIGQERLEGELKAIHAALRPVAAIGDRLQEFLLEQATKR